MSILHCVPHSHESGSNYQPINHSTTGQLINKATYGKKVVPIHTHISKQWTSPMIFHLWYSRLTDLFLGHHFNCYLYAACYQISACYQHCQDSGSRLLSEMYDSCPLCFVDIFLWIYPHLWCSCDEWSSRSDGACFRLRMASEQCNGELICW